MLLLLLSCMLLTAAHARDVESPATGDSSASESVASGTTTTFGPASNEDDDEADSHDNAAEHDDDDDWSMPSNSDTAPSGHRIITSAIETTMTSCPSGEKLSC